MQKKLSRPKFLKQFVFYFPHGSNLDLYRNS